MARTKTIAPVTGAFMTNVGIFANTSNRSSIKNNDKFVCNSLITDGKLTAKEGKVLFSSSDSLVYIYVPVGMLSELELFESDGFAQVEVVAVVSPEKLGTTRFTGGV